MTSDVYAARPLLQPSPRLRRRSDLARAVTRFGGCVAVAEQIGWKPPRTPRRPSGYWADEANLRAEIDAVILEGGRPQGVMPTRVEFEALGHSSVYQALEKWGGISVVRQ